MKKILAIAALSAGFVAAPVMAADSGPYVGVGLGHSHFDLDKVDGVKIDRGGVSTSAFVGYDFNKHFGIEAGYHKLGKVKASDAVESLSSRPTALTIEGVIKHETFKNTTLFAKTGLAYTKQKVSGFPNNDATGLVVGFGADYALTTNASLRAQVQYFPDFADSGQAMYNTSVGLKYAF